MFFYIKVSSKDDQVLNKFSKFLIKLEKLPAIVEPLSNQKKKKFVTILKSPHVNKTAQEQFEFRYYSKELFLDSIRPLTTFVILKKIENLSFPGIKFRIKSLFNRIHKRNKSSLKVFDPDNIILDKNNLFCSQKKYFQLFDCYGEAYMRNLSYLTHKNKLHF